MMGTALLRACLLACLSWGLSTATWAQSVALTGMLGQKALLIVDGGAPKSVGVGERHQGVKVVSVQGEQAVLEIAGQRHTLRVGDAPASVGAQGGATPSGSKIVLSAGTGGHFLTHGYINGRTVQLLVDTGATLVSLSVQDADRLGLAYKSGPTVQLSTANGLVPGWRLKLNSVRLGDVTVYEVDAIVTSGAMPYVLLGNSFLSRFQMNRVNDQMILEKRF